MKNKVENKIEFVSKSVNSLGIRPQGAYYDRGHLIHSQSNCKLTIFDGVNQIDYRKTDSLDTVKKILSQCRIVVYFNTTDSTIADFYRNNFEIYSESKIPVGYGGGYQYHIFIRNKNGQPNQNYARPVEKDAISNKTNLEAVLKVALKNKGKKKKADLIKEISEKLQ